MNETLGARRAWFQYSLRTLLLLSLLVAVYLAGLYAGRDRPQRLGEVGGRWQADLPAGFRRPVVLRHVQGNHFRLTSPADVFNGIYVWKDDKLTMVRPSDSRMQGLIWTRQRDKLVLTGEPAGTPTGASYLGTTLQRLSTAGK